MKFALIQRYRGLYPLPLMCRVLEVSRSGFYAHLRHRGRARTEADEVLLGQIRSVHAESRASYGSPRIHQELRGRGVRVSRKRIARLMRHGGLRGKAARRRRPRQSTSERGPHLQDLVQRCFRVAQPDTVWVADLTYIPTREGWLYLAVVLDLCSRRVVGWRASCTSDVRLSLGALEMALGQRRCRQQAIHHSDRGVHYSCTAYQRRLREHGLTPSFGRVGQCWDNAVAESFFGSLKTEALPPGGYHSRAQARRALFDYIEVWYNRRRRHSTLGYLSPAEYERRLHLTVH